MTKTASDVKRVCSEVYDRYAQGRDPWSLGAALDEAKEQVAATVPGAAQDLLEAAVEKLVGDLDKRRRDLLGNDQISLLALDSDHLDAVIPVGDGLRVQLRYAGLNEWDAWYGIQIQNHRAQVEAFSRRTNLYQDVRVQLLRGGVVGDYV